MIEDDVTVSDEFFGSMWISNFDSVTRTSIEQPYLSFIIYLDDKEIYAEKKTVTEGGITYTRIVSVLALVGGLWGPLTAIIKILLAKWTEAAFTLHIVKSIFLTKTLDEVDDPLKSPDFENLKKSTKEKQVDKTDISNILTRIMKNRGNVNILHQNSVYFAKVSFFLCLKKCCR